MSTEHVRRQAMGQLPLSVSNPELLSNGNDVQFREFVHDLIALSARTQEVLSLHARYLQVRYGIDLTPSQITLLTAVSRMVPKGPVLIRDLAEYLRVTPSFVSMETNALARAGMLTKRQSRDDQRVQIIELTPTADDILSKSTIEKVAVNDIFFAGMSEEEFSVLRRVVRRLVTNADRAIAMQMRLATEQRVGQ